MLPENNNTGASAATETPKAPKSINATSTTTMWEPTPEEADAALLSEDPIGALRMQRAASLEWEARQYALHKAARRNRQVHGFPREKLNGFRRRLVHFAKQLPIPSRD